MLNSLTNILEDYFSGKILEKDEIVLVNAHRQDCINKAMNPAITLPGTRFRESFEVWTKLAEKMLTGLGPYFHKSINGKRCIELGPGMDPMADWLFAHGASEYIGVEPFHPELTREELQDSEKSAVIDDKEALGFLLQQPDESALVFSRGVLCPELQLCNTTDYFSFIAKESYRVTPKGCPNIHITSTLGEEDNIVARAFKNAGFYAVLDRGDNTIWIKQ